MGEFLRNRLEESQVTESAVRIEIGGAAWNVSRIGVGVLMIVMPEMPQRTRTGFVPAIGRGSRKARLRRNQQDKEEGEDPTHSGRSIYERSGRSHGLLPLRPIAFPALGQHSSESATASNPKTSAFSPCDRSRRWWMRGERKSDR